LCLIAFHPLIWTTLLFSIHGTVLLFFMIQTLFQIERKKPSYLLLFASQLLLSLSLEAGLLFAWFLLFYSIGCKHMDQKNQTNSLVLWAALMPATIKFGLLSFNAGVPGGAYFAGLPTLASSISLTTVLNGTWSEQLAALFYYVGNGCLETPLQIPVWGITALIGWKVWYQDSSRKSQRVGFALLWIWCFLLFAFWTPAQAQNHLLILFVILTGFSVAGLDWLRKHYSHLSIHTILLGLLFFLLLQGWFHEISQRYTQAAYTKAVCEEIEDALSHHPAVAANDMAISGLKIGHHAQTIREKSEALFSLPSLKPPSLILTYSLPGGNGSEFSIDHLDYADILSSSYQETRHKRLRLFALESQIVPPADLQQVGMAWTFDDGEYQHATTQGLAFGLRPAREQSPRGPGYAGDATKGSHLGSLTSDAFTIEGDDLHFLASLPSDSTSSIFCLSVYQEASIHPQAEVKTVRHIYDREPGAPLMDDTFYYILPKDLSYHGDCIRGWRVVRALQHAEKSSWMQYQWSLDPWKNMQAVWQATDRDFRSSLRLDHVIQTKRVPGVYWNFETGTYEGWEVRGEAFGTHPATGAYGGQGTVTGVEGNFFVNSFHRGSDRYTGEMLSPEFSVTFDALELWVGGGDNINQVRVELQIEGEAVTRATGNRKEQLRKVVWNLSPWKGKRGRIHIVDESFDSWGHILVDNIRTVAAPQTVERPYSLPLPSN